MCQFVARCSRWKVLTLVGMCSLIWLGASSEAFAQAEKPSGEAAKDAATAKENDASATPAGDAQKTDQQASGDHKDGGHTAHHDPTDLGHQDASAKLEDPSQWKSDLAIGTLLVFLGLLLLLSKFAWRPIMEGLEARERAIAANIEEARRSAEKAGEQLRQYEVKLAAATEEAREIITQARKDADSARERIMADAQEAATRERQRAVEDITAAKNVALQEMTQKSVDLAVAIAGRLVRQQLSREDHAQLIREMLDQFPSRN